MIRINTVLLTASMALICTPVWAGKHQPGYDRARVVHVTPVYEVVRYPVYQARYVVPRNWRTEQRIAGWNVDYRYRGVVYRTRMHQKPGKHIRVAVNATTVAYYPGR